MHRRALLATLSAAPFLPGPARADSDQAVLSRIAAYLNGIRTLRARFRQVAPDGAVSTGTVWLKRPGQMRFQYDPPSPLLLIATGGQVIFEDRSINQVSRIPLSRTPLGILLSDHVDFGGPVAVRQVRQLPGEIQVSVVRAIDPGAGLLAMAFGTDPLRLYAWTVVDPQQKITRVSLSDMQVGVSINPSLFVFHPPAAR